MDDVMVRSRYPRHTTPARRRSRCGKEKSKLPVIIARQMLICLILLLVIFLVKSINTPITNYISDKVHFVLQQNIELNSIFKSFDNALSKLKDEDLLNKGTDGKSVEGSTDVDDMVDKSNEATTSPETSVLSASTEEGGDLIVGMINPVSGVLSSSFGERKDPLSGVTRQHEGIDIEAAKGESISAVLDGIVIETGTSKSYGNYIKIRHNERFETMYAHCSVVSVVQGQKVAQGDVIGKVGNTGAAVGVHLHFEVWKDDKPVNPLEYVSVPLP